VNLSRCMKLLSGETSVSLRDKGLVLNRCGCLGQGACHQYRNFKNEKDRSELVEESEAAEIWIAG